MVLEPVGSGIWLAEGPVIRFYGFPYPTRTVIVRLANAALWVWSPSELTDSLQREVDALGQVTYLVSPSPFHHRYLQDWQACYPLAQLWGPQSTCRKRSDLSFTGMLADEPPQAWANEIEQAWLRGSEGVLEVGRVRKVGRAA